jgi:hypothetical protein
MGTDGDDARGVGEGASEDVLRGALKAAYQLRVEKNKKPEKKR